MRWFGYADCLVIQTITLSLLAASLFMTSLLGAKHCLSFHYGNDICTPCSRKFEMMHKINWILNTALRLSN